MAVVVGDVGRRFILLIYKEAKFCGDNIMKPTTASHQKLEPDWEDYTAPL
jgi:hypothetical protein